MKLTKSEALRRHRLMWNWIAQTSIQEQRCVQKTAAFIHFGWGPVEFFCWCCEYDTPNRCRKCPITHCGPYYGLWCNACEENNYISAAKYAYQLAELPENPDA